MKSDVDLLAVVAAHPDLRLGYGLARSCVLSLQWQLQERWRGLAKFRLVALNNHVTTVWPERVRHLVRLVKGPLLKRLKTEMSSIQFVFYERVPRGHDGFYSIAWTTRLEAHRWFCANSPCQALGGAT